jgi:hypothetical protein
LRGAFYCVRTLRQFLGRIDLVSGIGIAVGVCRLLGDALILMFATLLLALALDAAAGIATGMVLSRTLAFLIAAVSIFIAAVSIFGSIFGARSRLTFCSKLNRPGFAGGRLV